uniref:Integrase core domain containing protein n=1 Tax=Solanum tuberosum TaxID=4113 RepID=M1DZS8_SOLTU
MCMAVTTRGVKQTIDLHMPSGVEIETSKDDDVVEERKGKSAEKGLVQRSTDPIDGLWFILRSVNGVRRSQVQAIHKRLDAFELRVLAQPAPVTKFSFFRNELDSLRADIDSILATPTDEPESAPTALADDIVLDVLFKEDTYAQSEPTRARGKRPRSSLISDTIDDARANKRECHQNEQARKASIVDEELLQQTVHESVARASSFVPVVEVLTVERDDMSTTDDAVRVIHSTTEGSRLDDVGTTEGDPRVVPVGSEKPNPPAC